MNILLVEDTDFVREELASILLEMSEVDEVVGLRGVAEGREAVASKAFDVWLLDFQLSDGTALDLLDELDRIDELTRPVAIVFTNHATSPVRERCREAGADHFFDKSSDLNELIEAVRALEAHSNSS